MRFSILLLLTLVSMVNAQCYYDIDEDEENIKKIMEISGCRSAKKREDKAKYLLFVILFPLTIIAIILMLKYISRNANNNNNNNNNFNYKNSTNNHGEDVLPEYTAVNITVPPTVYNPSSNGINHIHLPTYEEAMNNYNNNSHV